MARNKKIELRIKRQESPSASPRWEFFAIDYRPNMNIISCLIEVAKDPVTAQGKKSTPVVWECACLEEVCGSCTMVINGKVRQSCSALVDNLEQPIELEPLSKFPTVRDLVVDRSKMFDNLKKVRAWNPIQGTYHLGEGQRVDPDTQQMMYDRSRCMTCACCLEVCPQINSKSSFIGPAAIGQVQLFNANPIGKPLAEERLNVMMDDGGVHACGNAQNCVKACPKEIKLTDAICEISRQVSVHAVRSFVKSR